MSSAHIANTPFDDPGADFILRTSDGVDFRVFRAVLSLASPVFKDMLSLPQPTLPSTPETPVVTISENSAVLEPLLLFFYPAVPPTIESLEDVRIMLLTATKYDFEAAIQEVSTQLVSPRFLETNPIGVYCVACHCGLEAEAKAAALQALNIPSLGRPVVEVDELALINIPTYHRLLRYHFKCGEVAAGVSNKDNWSLVGMAVCRLPFCDCADVIDDEGVPSRLLPIFDVLPNIADELRRRPSPATAAQSVHLKDAVEKLRGCNTCSREIENGTTLRELVDGIGSLVRDEVEKVPLEFKD
ncbi:hypothetical protein CONPUDRAFT_74099 [Coniophora puteana RWD-64-598 SS2]|uniref:BTB domain-containing protein n=1 Tax=Coniophora puteana (strain RWD-64-598) TaxID=741705 RepID=A0A5M3MM41_CONPW|nr:uncharacterized protein CONPUDRAFT_74099 [Coniophora puteana RWD-64-598 SS2]EIW79745.1 hypothetical protein CONPUDRAFT_74099 [Coniophora puteana RWD-64-598 SS2]